MQDNLLRFNKDKRIFWYDLETYNLNLHCNVTTNVPWQIALIEMTGDQETAREDLIIKWDTKLICSPEAARVNHFDQNRIDRDGISPEEAFKIFEPIFARADWIAGHNILGFDLYLMIGYYKLFGKKFDFIDKSIDTNFIAKGLKLNLPYSPNDSFIEYQYKLLNKRAKVKTRLGILCEEYGIPYDEKLAHDGLYDVKCDIALWGKLKYQIEI